MTREKKIRWWYLLLVALIQFPLKLAGNLRYLTYIYIYVIPIIYLILNINWLFSFFNRIKTIRLQLFKIIYIYLFTISILWPLIFRTFDFSFVTLYWRGFFLWILKYVFLIAVFEKHISSENDIEYFVEYLGRSIMLYTLFSLICVLIPSFRKIAMQKIYLSTTDIINYQRAEYGTRFGWSGWSSFNETAICTITVVILCILILKNNNNIKKQTHFLILSIFPLLGNALYGRIGLLTSLVSIGFTCCFVFFKGNMKYIFIILVVAIGLYFIFVLLKDKVAMFKDWYQWVFSAFANYRKTGKFYDNMGSVQHLTSDMYWLPKMDTFLFGDGRYTNTDGTYYMYTDSGVMRPMLFYGIINYFISVMATFFVIIEFSINTVGHSNKKNIKLAIFLLLMSISIFEFKGESIWMFLAMIIPLTYLTRRKNNSAS